MKLDSLVRSLNRVKSERVQTQKELEKTTSNPTSSANTTEKKDKPFHSLAQETAKITKEKNINNAQAKLDRLEKQEERFQHMANKTKNPEKSLENLERSNDLKKAKVLDDLARKLPEGSDRYAVGSLGNYIKRSATISKIESSLEDVQGQKEKVEKLLEKNVSGVRKKLLEAKLKDLEQKETGMKREIAEQKKQNAKVLRDCRRYYKDASPEVKELMDGVAKDENIHLKGNPVASLPSRRPSFVG